MSNKNIILFVVCILIGGAIYYLESTRAHAGNTGPSTSLAISATTTSTTAISTAGTISSSDIAAIRAAKALKYKSAVEIVDPAGFVNTGDSPGSTTGKPIKIADYIGKDVILIDFMTYSCINCQRTFPYTTAWYGKYKDQGFVIIGIHTPEFDFEKNYANVKAAMARYGITYPVVLDNNYGTWTAYGNEYWPREYLIDIDGYIREDHIGEGGYGETEKNIQDLITERDQRLGITPTFDTALVNPAGAVTSIQAQSPETYFGSNRNQYLGNGNPSSSGTQMFTLPKNLADNTFYFSGSWNVESEYAETNSPSAGISYVFNAMNVYFVAGAKDANTPVTAEVTLDGAPVPTSLRGSDIYESNGKTYVKVDMNRLYSIIKGTALMHHTLQINSQGAGLDAYTFTFG